MVKSQSTELNKKKRVNSSVYVLGDSKSRNLNEAKWSPSKVNPAKVAYGIMMKNRADYYHFLSSHENNVSSHSTRPGMKLMHPSKR